MASHRGYRSSRFRWLGILPVVAALLLATAPVLASAQPSQARAGGEWLPAHNITVDDPAQLPITLNDGDVLLIRDVTYSAETGVSPIALADNATATVIVEGAVELHGAAAEGRTGATPAIEVPETATLIVYGAHDEELAGTYGAPEDSLIVTGGDPAAGEDGQDARSAGYGEGNVDFLPTSGNGGAGGGGGAAAIGGRGGDGGAGGAGTAGSMTREGEPRVDWWARWKNDELASIEGSGNDGTMGRDGETAEEGEQGAGCGSVYLLGRLNITASTSGENATGGHGGSGDGGGNDNDDGIGIGDGKTWELYGGAGGGGGGGGGTAAPAIGAGGAGGSGGGGGTGPSDDAYSGIYSEQPHPDTAPGGGGGGGGWPNGGGGGGGGPADFYAYAVDADSYGGDGGPGGEDNGIIGAGGYIISERGERWDRYPGRGGAGAGGIDSTDQALGGIRVYAPGYTIHDPDIWSGSGGYGGGPVAAREWGSSDSKSVLVMSTAGLYTLSNEGSLGYACGSGGGSGADARVATEPRLVYEAEDLAYEPVSGAEGSYTYTSEQIRPEGEFGTSARYTAESDRDGQLVPGAVEEDLSVSTTGDPVYGENIHCPVGTVTFDATGLTDRADVLGRLLDPSDTEPIIVGSQITWRFPINKATFTEAPISWSTEGDVPRVGEPITLSLDSYVFKGADGEDVEGSLSELWLDADGTVGAPTVFWSAEGVSYGEFSSDGSLQTTFTPYASGKVVIRAAILYEGGSDLDMNDFVHYETTLELEVRVGSDPVEITLDDDGDACYGDLIPFTVTGPEGVYIEKVVAAGDGEIRAYDPLTGEGTLKCAGAGTAIVIAICPESSGLDIASVEVAKRSITAEWSGTEDRVYDGTASAVRADFDDYIFRGDQLYGDVISPVTGGNAVLGGRHTATVELAGGHADDFVVTNPTVEYEILQAASSTLTPRVLNEEGTQEIDSAVYGDVVMLEAVVTPGTAGAPGARTGDSDAPDAPDASTFTFTVDGEELEGERSEVSVGTDGSFTMRFTYDTASRQMPVDVNEITFSFAGDDSMPAAEETDSLTLERAPLGISLEAAYEKPYDGTTEVTGVEFSFRGAVGDDKPYVTWDDAAWIAADPGTDTVRVSGIALGDDYGAWYDLDDGVEADGIEERPLNRAAIRAADVDVTVELEGKVYDGEPVGEPEVAVTAEAGTVSTGEVTVTWFASDGQGGWNEIEGAPADAGDYKVEATVAADDNHNASAEPGVAFFTIAKAPQDAPSGVTSTGETSPDASDGTISGMPAGSEWRPEGGAWADAPEDGAVEGLAPGVYEVRMKGDANHEPSEPVTVRVGAASALAGIIGSIGGASGDAQGGIPGTGDPATIAGVLAVAGATALAVGTARRRR